MGERSIITKFLNEYSNKSNILGIIFYGSSNYQTVTKNSNIDLIIIIDINNNYKKYNR